MSTIAAIATGPAAGGIGIIRLSGPAALGAARVVVPTLSLSPVARRATYARFTDERGEVLDEGLVLYFKAPHSFTGEDVVELHAHGAPRLLSMVLEALLKHPEVRLATPGEFTRRAFLSGRVDLTKAEAIADLIAAESEAQVRAAAAQLSGALHARLMVLHQPLLALHADLEGELDFPEEADGASGDVGQRIDRLLLDARALLSQSRQGALLRKGARVVLFGPVNAGKSTLFNAVVGVDRALVDDEPGTTRDVLEARIELGGLSVTLVDTAGLRDGAGRLEALGIERTRAAVRGADLAVLVLPPSASVAEQSLWRTEAHDTPVLEVWGKADVRQGEGLAVSGRTGHGIDALKASIHRALGGGVAGAVVNANERHVAALTQLVDTLARARVACDTSTLEVVAGEVALAVSVLAEVIGTDASTELLDAVFQRFCIGK
jgi:tRNA modification GTPase